MSERGKEGMERGKREGGKREGGKLEATIASSQKGFLFL